MKSFNILLIALFSLCIQFSATAQFGIGGTKKIQEIKNTTTYIVLGYEDAYNKAIKNAFEKYWTFTPYEFISGPQFKDYCERKDASFILLFTIQDWAFVEEEYRDVGIVKGGRCRYAPEDMVAYSNLIVGADFHYETVCIRAVQMMQNYLELGLKRHFSEDNYIETYQAYSESKNTIHEKQLVLTEYDLLEEFMDLKAIKKLYRHDVSIVHPSEVFDIVLNQEEDKVYHYLAFDVHGYRYHLAIQGKDSKVLFGKEANGKDDILLGKKSLVSLD